MATVPKLIYKCDVFPIKIPAEVFMEIDKLNLDRNMKNQGQTKQL